MKRTACSTHRQPPPASIPATDNWQLTTVRSVFLGCLDHRAQIIQFWIISDAPGAENVTASLAAVLNKFAATLFDVRRRAGDDQ